MGVLESMRSSSDSTFMQVVLVAVIVSFVGWMAMPQGDKTTAVARVNGEPIMDTEYRRLFARVVDRREQEQNRPLSNEEEENLGEMVRQELIRNEVVLQAARATGLTVSNYELLWEVTRTGQLAGFADEAGVVDEQEYKRFLQRQGLTKGTWESQLIEGLLVQKAKELALMGVTISEPILRELYEANQRRVTVTYAAVRPGDFFERVEVTDAEVAAWLEENEAEAREIYDRDFERRFKHPEQLELGLIKLEIREGQSAADLLPRINAVREELLAGGDFEQLARKHSEDPSAGVGGMLGLKPVLKIAPEVTQAVGDTEVGAITRVVPGDDDVRIYKVLQRTEASEDSFEEASRTIAVDAIKKKRATEVAIDFARNELLPAWTEAGEVPSDLLSENGLSSQTSRPMASTDPAPAFGPPAEVYSKAMDAEKGTVLPEVFESRGVYWVAQVSDKQEADLALFESRRETIRSQELFTRRQQFLENWITDLVAQADVR